MANLPIVCTSFQFSAWLTMASATADHACRQCECVSSSLAAGSGNALQRHCKLQAAQGANGHTESNLAD